jgi:hypothetical protein
MSAAGVNGWPSQFAVRYWTTSTRTGCTVGEKAMPRTPEEFNDYVAKELRAAYAALIK